MTTTLTVEGMTCSSCISHVKQALAIEGVSAVDVRLADQVVTIEHESRITNQELRRLLDRAGYPVVATPSARAGSSGGGCCCGPKTQSALR